MESLIQPLTKDFLRSNLEDILELESNWTSLGEIPWNRENFYLELPGKWKLSVIASVNNKIVGYAIASLDNNIAKLNKILVDDNYRKKGIATRLWDSLLSKCREAGVYRIEFKALKENIPALEFYKKNNCLIYGETLGADGRLRYDIKYVFKTNRIRHSRPTIHEDDIVSVSEVIKSRNLATKETVEKFVNKFKDYIGKRYGAATNNGTSALHLALRSMDIKEGDEVILPSFVCGSVLSAVKHARASPVIADINENDYNLSLEDVKKKITKNTKAIILPHMFGKPSTEIEEFLKLNIPIIEDCAQSLGAKHNHKKTGSFGYISIFSFYATKVMTTGSGGMILTDDENIFKKIKDLMEYDNRQEFGECYNYDMNDISAALGISQLKRLDDFIKKRIEIAKLFNDKFKEIPELKLPDPKENIFFRYIIRKNNAEEFIKNLKYRGIDASKPVFIPLHKYLNFPDSDFPNTAKLYNETISIPLYPYLNSCEISDLTSIIKNFKKECGVIYGK